MFMEIYLVLIFPLLKFLNSIFIIIVIRYNIIASTIAGILQCYKFFEISIRAIFQAENEIVCCYSYTSNFKIELNRNDPVKSTAELNKKNRN